MNKGGTNPKFKDKFKFFVNSYYKTFGRSLEVELMDSNIGSDDDIGYGIIDLDPYLNMLNLSAPSSQPPPSQPQQGGQMQQSKGPSQLSRPIQMRCFLNFKRKPAGFVTF